MHTRYFWCFSQSTLVHVMAWFRHHPRCARNLGGDEFAPRGALFDGASTEGQTYNVRSRHGHRVVHHVKSA